MDEGADAVLARRLADAAGTLLWQMRADVHDPVDSVLGDRADAAAHESLVAGVAAARPDDAVLSEEGDDSPARLNADRVWIIDPLDGTREYAAGRDDWAVHVALWAHGDLVAGAVALPSLDLTVGTDDPPLVPDAVPGRRPRIAVSRTRPPAAAQRAAATLDAELVPMGSAGFKAGAVLRGEVDAYLHDGGQFEWDSAAPVAVARAAGLHTSRTDGSPLRYNRPDPYLPDLLICRTELADALLAAAAPDGEFLPSGSTPTRSRP